MGVSHVFLNCTNGTKSHKAPHIISQASNFTKINTPPWVFFTFFKIVQMVPNRKTHHILYPNFPFQEKRLKLVSTIFYQIFISH